MRANLFGRMCSNTCATSAINRYQEVKRYKVRYIFAGERGTQGTRRCHWHGILFFYNAVPDFQLSGYTHKDPFWEHGITTTRKADARGIAYVCKYCTKGVDPDNPGSESVFHASTRPMLGAKHFANWAKLHAEQGLPLNQGRKYQIAGVYSAKTKRLFDYWMTPSAAKFTVAAYLKAWAEKYGVNSHPPHSEIVEKFADQEAKSRLLTLQDAAAMERVQRGGYVSQRVRRAEKPCEPPPVGYRQFYDEHLMVYVAAASDGSPTIFWDDRGRRWRKRLVGRKVRVTDWAQPRANSAGVLPDLPGEAPREFRSVAEIPDYVPGEALDLSGRRKKPGERERYAARKAQEYHRQMVAVRMDRVAAAIKRLRDDGSEGAGGNDGLPP